MASTPSPIRSLRSGRCGWSGAEVAADEADNTGDESDGPVGRDVVSSGGDREENVGDRTDSRRDKRGD
jgi:hypothetical protein